MTTELRRAIGRAIYSAYGIDGAPDMWQVSPYRDEIDLIAIALLGAPELQQLLADAEIGRDHRQGTRGVWVTPDKAREWREQALADAVVKLEQDLVDALRLVRDAADDALADVEEWRL